MKHILREEKENERENGREGERNIFLEEENRKG